MRFTRAVHPQPGSSQQTLGTHVEAGLCVPAHRQPDQIRHRAAAHQQAAGPDRHPHQSGHPANHLLLDQRCGVIESPYVRVHASGQHLRQYALRSPIAHDPAPETGMRIPDSVRQHVPQEALISRHGPFARARDRLLLDGLSCLRRESLPHGLLSSSLQMVEDSIDHPMAKRPERGPFRLICGIQGCLFSI